jgi:uncharacterized protein
MSTDIERNKALAAEFFGRFTAGDLPGVMASFTDDATWWIPGRREQIPSAGLYDRQKIGRLFQAMIDALKDGLKMTVKSALAEGDEVAVEVESYGELKNGRVYQQQYHLRMRFRDGKVCAVREYLDTQHVYDVWFKP